MKNGYEIAALFVEQGESAKTADRTELKKLMSYCAIKKNGINAVIAYKIDRISRNTDDYSQIRILLKRYGVEIKSTSEYFEDTPAGRFMENIIANVAQFDNDVRAERSTGGMRDAVREGRYVWMAPYGYSNVKVSGKSTIAPSHLAPLIRKAFEQIALDIYPIKEIRKDLIGRGLVNTLGKPISKSNFYHVIKNELYTGWIEKFGERHKGNFEPIVSEELFKQVQRVLLRKNRKFKHYLIESPDFPLRRFIRHPSGKMLTGSWCKGRLKKYPYYIFPGHKFNIRKEVLEKMFKDWLNQFKMDIDYFEKIKSLVKERLDNGIDSKKTKVEKLEKSIHELKVKQTLLLEKNIEGVISNDLCKEKMSDIDEQLYQIKKAIKSLLEKRIDFSHLLNIIRDFLLNPGEAWEKASIQQKIKLQRFYFPYGIVLDKNESRTSKICKLFNLKQEIYPLLSYNVPHLKSNLNTSNLQVLKIEKNTIDTTTSNGIQDEQLWQALGEEIAYLANLTKESSLNCQSSVLQGKCQQ